MASNRSLSSSCKVFYDDFSGRFVSESLPEAVKRKSRRHERETAIQNQAKLCSLEQQYKQVENDRNLFTMRYTRQREETRNTLKVRSEKWHDIM